MSHRFITRIIIKYLSSIFSLCTKTTTLEVEDEGRTTERLCDPILDVDVVPDEVVFEVLLRLPAKSLVRFRCVSKFWSATISQPYFIKSHLNTIIKRNNHQTTTLINYYNFDCVKTISVKYSTSIGNHPDEEEEEEYFVDLHPPNPPIPWPRHSILVGSCNGILCFREVKPPCDIFLWNPIIRQCRCLPNCRLSGGQIISVAFVFDPVNDDYKVVRITACGIDVYSLRNDSWKKINLFINPDSSWMGILNYIDLVALNGSVHWLAKSPETNTLQIISFDARVEVFSDMTILNSIEPTERERLSVLEGCICVFVQLLNKDCQVWVMKEYGVVESWTKEFTIPHDLHIGRPVGFTSTGEIFITKNEGNMFFLMSYDPTRKRIKDLRVHMAMDMLIVINHLESLVSVDQGNY